MEGAASPEISYHYKHLGFNNPVFLEMTLIYKEGL
jgi:hypothetical protein